MTIRRTTPKQFSLFKNTCQECVKRWGIVGWHIHYKHEKLSGARVAQVATQVFNRVAWISLRSEWDDSQIDFPNLDDAAVIRTARHEVTHLLLAPLADVVSARYLTEDHEREANESVCNHVMSLLP
jgi:hypothetical protein